MEIMEFCQKVKRSLAAESEEGIKISVKEITKNNGIILHSITISKTGMNISPNIYLDGLYDAYESGRTFRSVMNEVRKIYEESKMESSIDMSFFMDYEKMKEKVVYKVIGYERNKELLRQIPHILFLDMALVFYCYVPKKELDCATILIYDSHLKMWGISKERLYWDAQRNTPHFLPPRIRAYAKQQEGGRIRKNVCAGKWQKAFWGSSYVLSRCSGRVFRKTTKKLLCASQFCP